MIEARPILLAFYYALLAFLVVLVLLRKREPAVAIAWSLAILFLPGIGILLFLFLGLPRVPARVRRRRRRMQAFRDSLGGEGASLIPSTGPPPDPFPASRGPGSVMRRVAEELSGRPRREGNRVELFVEGRAAFDAVFEAIERATRFVHVQSYIFRSDPLGREFLERLSRKAAQGVEVRLLVDAIGSFGEWRPLAQLRRAGGRGAPFFPLGFLRRWFTLNLRNHRKSIVCDGRVGFFGGLNVGEEYLGRPASKRGWFDAHVRLEGPAVTDLQRVFAEDWHFATGEILAGSRYESAVDPCGLSSAQIVDGGPHQGIHAVRQVYFAAAAGAQNRLWIATPYLVPDASIRDAIRTAALGGVEVLVLTQGHPPDNRVAHLVSHYVYGELLDEGVRIFEYQAGMMHAKTLIVDGEIASVGSANLDNRSLHYNYELLGLFDQDADVRALEGLFLRALERSTEVRPDSIRRRTWRARISEEAARLLEPLV